MSDTWSKYPIYAGERYAEIVAAFSLAYDLKMSGELCTPGVFEAKRLKAEALADFLRRMESLP